MNETGGGRCAHCGATGPRTWMFKSWLCHRCALGAEFDARTGPPELLPPALVPVRAAVMTAGSFYIARKWLRNSQGGQLLTRLAAGEAALTHETLDQAGGNRSVEHLRALLVAAGALPDTTTIRRVERLGDFTAGLLAAARIDTSDAKAAQTWLRWQVLPRLRRRAETGAPMAHSLNNARRTLRAVLALLEATHRNGRTLATLTQADLDHWFAQPAGTHWLARGFLAWARDRHHLSPQVTIPPAPPKVMRSPLNHEQRWATARRLVTDNTIPADDRVAAALLVLYGQPLTRIARLTRDDIRHGSDGTVLVVLDGTPCPSTSHSPP
ncbi:MAG TPA: hypothetical protein VGS19_18220 [Streptosporangiaceae bacterium]|nr:hypothetical protein [Streptosporangiaceae bacterium]